MPQLDGVSACHLIRQVDNTPIIAMTSNIRSDDIAMYFQNGMNDVLPKPFTKEGLLNMLEKHLDHLKKSSQNLDPITIPGNIQSIKNDDTPTSPATWNSPSGGITISPNDVGADFSTSAVTSALPLSATSNSNATNNYRPFGGSPQGQLRNQIGIVNNSTANNATTSTTPTGHRRQISKISGGAMDLEPASKRQQLFSSPSAGLASGMQMGGIQGMNSMNLPSNNVGNGHNVALSGGIIPVQRR